MFCLVLFGLVGCAVFVLCVCVFIQYLCLVVVFVVVVVVGGGGSFVLV